MNYWTALDLLKQCSGELGVPEPQAIPDATDVQTNQLLALLNASGNELLLAYPWEQLVRVWNFSTVAGVDSYQPPADFGYFVDQTQWDQTNHWPMLGPKTPQEWSWLKGGLVAAAPRMRYRIYNDKFIVHPVPGSTSFTFRMEYIASDWVAKQADSSTTAMVTAGGDIVMFHPWLMVKFMKLKFCQLKGLDPAAAQQDFMRLFQGLIGKDRGAPKLSLTPHTSPLFLGPWSVPDGSWDVGITP